MSAAQQPSNAPRCLALSSGWLAALVAPTRSTTTICMFHLRHFTGTFSLRETLTIWQKHQQRHTTVGTVRRCFLLFVYSQRHQYPPLYAQLATTKRIGGNTGVCVS